MYCDFGHAAHGRQVLGHYGFRCNRITSFTRRLREAINIGVQKTYCSVRWEWDPADPIWYLHILLAPPNVPRHDNLVSVGGTGIYYENYLWNQIGDCIESFGAYGLHSKLTCSGYGYKETCLARDDLIGLPSISVPFLNIPKAVHELGAVHLNAWGEQLLFRHLGLPEHPIQLSRFWSVDENGDECYAPVMVEVPVSWRPKYKNEQEYFEALASKMHNDDVPSSSSASTVSQI